MPQPQSQYGTLVAATVTTVTLTGTPSRVEIMNRSGTAEIFATTNGVTPTVAGADEECIAAAVGAAIEVEMSGGGNAVKLISSGTPTWGVRVIE